MALVHDDALTFLDPIRIWKRSSSEFRMAFLTALIAGFLTHLYAFTNLLLSNDAVNNAFSRNEHLVSGRWALGFFSSSSSYVQMPMVIGLLSVLALALTAGLTVLVLELHSTIGIMLTSILLVTFPTVACTFAYMFTADAYFIALFFNAAAVYLTKRFRFGWIPAVLLIAVGCGIYQAYFNYAVTLFLLDCIFRLLQEADLKKTVLLGFRYVGYLMASLLLYWAIEMLLLRYHQATLTTYMGMDTIAGLDLLERLQAIPKAYGDFCYYWSNWSFAIPLAKLFHWGIVAVLIGSVIYLLILKRVWIQPVRCILILLGCALLPLTMNLSAVLAYEGSVHRLMIYSFILLCVAGVKCAELVIAAGTGLSSVLSLTALLCCGVVAWNNFCLCNVGYHALTLNYENTYAIAERVTVRLEELEGYEIGGPVAIVGYVSSDFYGTKSFYSPTFNTALNGEAIHEPLVFRSFFQYYIGFPIPSLTAEQREFLNNSPEVAAMPAFPAKNSVAMINGIAVVKLGEGSIQ